MAIQSYQNYYFPILFSSDQSENSYTLSIRQVENKCDQARMPIGKPRTGTCIHGHGSGCVPTCKYVSYIPGFTDGGVSWMKFGEMIFDYLQKSMSQVITVTDSSGSVSASATPTCTVFQVWSQSRFEVKVLSIFLLMISWTAFANEGIF